MGPSCRVQLGVDMVTQEERIAERSGDGVPAVAMSSPHAPEPLGPPRPRGRRWVTLLVTAVVTTTAVGLWRLSGEEQGAAAPESRMRSTAGIGADGSVDVVQRIDLASARSSLTVSIPVRSAPADRFDPRVDQVRVHADGRPEAGLTAPLVRGGTHTFTFAGPATSVVLEYSVEGAVVATPSSAQGRALALVTPLAIEGAVGMASRLEVERDGVLNLGCSADGAPMTACGADDGGRWTVGRGVFYPVADVIAQVDLSGAAARQGAA